MAQDRNLSGQAKTWLITGASSGLGYALAKYVLEQGDRVAMGARTLDTMAGLGLPRMPVASVTAAMPPRPKDLASDAAHNRILRSSSTGASASCLDRISSIRATSIAIVRRGDQAHHFHRVSMPCPFHYSCAGP